MCKMTPINVRLNFKNFILISCAVMEFMKERWNFLCFFFTFETLKCIICQNICAKPCGFIPGTHALQVSLS